MDLTTIDRCVALAGFALTLWQLHRTRTAANAARESALQAVAAIRRLEAATKMHDISSRSRELLRLLRNKNFEPAASAAFELRDTVARYRHDDQSSQIVSVDVWSKAVSDVASVHEQLEFLAMQNDIGSGVKKELLAKVAKLHTLFTSLAATAEAKGAANAYPD